MKMHVKKVVATVAMAGAVTAGTAGMAYAQDSSGSGSGSAKPAAAAQGHPRFRLAVRRHAGKIVADTLGMSRKDLRAALKSGQSINEIAGSPEKQAAVKTALVNAANTAIDTAVANGRIDPAKGAELKGKVEPRVDKAMNHHFGQGGA